MALKEGTKAPDFELPSTSGKLFKLSQTMRGKPCIIYFYPKDFTPGCTAEACEFRNTYDLLAGLGVTVFGISRDSIETHLRFKQAHKLPFELLADEDGSVAAKYKAAMPIIKITKRITYLLDAEHNIAAVYENLFGAKKHIDMMVKKLNPSSV